MTRHDTKILLRDEIENPTLSIIHAIHEHSDPIVPFSHALKMAVAAKGELEIVDVRKTSDTDLGVRSVLGAWGLLAPDADRSDVEKIGVKVKKIVKHGDTKREIGKRLEKHHHDIMVLGTETRKGFAGLFGVDLTEYLVQNARQSSLFIPRKARPFVDPRTGTVSLRKILVPVALEPSAEPAIELLRRVLKIFPDQTPEIVGLHVGEQFPYISASLLEGLNWKEVLSDESISSAILKTAREQKADLVVMATNGRDTLSQKIIGSLTEQVLRSIYCPVLAVAID